ncbi:LysR family transcriptional regulator [Meridianimarinicoccus aquatilis]|uniref:LysR family transcriptional regulator n=1 Tax=Meridianimarinicoccus aquatilis TaxID=2552766 RepID=A0A4R6AQD5_9RHOB|nr:LysR family transcriptional regulator [Fluviibacterium aquatile]QIE40829.1 LysR family transcriptional regulator [Rhodobacteraceae bacterium SC52]TDL85785.1 LysR family transcriptional regulator [Fluviibacterium aquatile]
MKDVNWDDLRLFLRVAEHGGLSSAARQTGVSAPTLGRRILALEQRIGQVLFKRAQTGYTLTAFGEGLLRRVKAMQAAAQPVQELIGAQGTRPVVRLSAGTGTAMFLADRYSALARPGDEFHIAFITAEAVLDIAHREIDLGIRNRPADTSNAASLRLGTLRFAPFRAWNTPRPDALGWVGIDPEHARHAASQWARLQGHPICVQTSSIATLHQLVRAGAGIGIMPCMVGDSDPALARAGPLVEELTEEQFLVMHDDDRHRAPVRRLIERLTRLYRDNADLLAGARPLRG